MTDKGKTPVYYDGGDNVRHGPEKHGALPWPARMHGILETTAMSEASSSQPCTPVERTLERPSNRPWWKDVVCYQVWPRSFKDSNQENKFNKGHGDIKGVIEKLDYLKGLGVDVVWLCPTYKSPQEDYGYDIESYVEIDKAFGTMDDMDELIKQVKARDMRIILDLVINHTSVKHKWFQEI